MPVKLFAYNPHSNSAKALAAALNIKRIKHGADNRWIGRPRDTVINWGGATDHRSFGGAVVLNQADRIATASDKLAFFRATDAYVQREELRVPKWTDRADEARAWILADEVVVARTVLRGHSGAGIHILDKTVDFVEAPLYTKYIKKEKEFRVHFAFGRQIDLQRKVKDPAFEGAPNWRVRNHHNGFIYTRNGVQAPEDVTRQALQAFTASGLDFGAVDVIWNERHKRAYVLEINTAPGLQGQTIEHYASAFRQALNLGA